MTHPVKIWILAIVGLVLWPALLHPCEVYAQVAIIANKSLNAKTIDKQKLIDIFTLEEIQWDNGGDIIPVEIKGKDPSKSSFYQYLERSANDIKRDRLRIILAGEATPPLIFDTTEEVYEKIRTTPGAIGYVPADIVPPETVNVLQIINR